MNVRVIFYFSHDTRNSISALLAGMIYRGVYRKVDICFAVDARDISKMICRGCLNILAFSVTTVNFYDRYNLLKHLRWLYRDRRDMIYVAGGPHADGDPESLVRAGFDLVFSGYAEDEFARYLEEHIIPREVTFPQIVYCSTSREWGRRSFAKITNNYYPPLEIQRGCRFRCTYCQSCKRMNRQIYKSVEAIDEYIEDFKRYRFSRFASVSPDAFDLRFSRGHRDPENIAVFFEHLISKGVKIIEYGQFPSEIRPSSDVDAFFRMLSLYVKNRKVVIGAQSLVDERLRKIKRGHSVEDIENTMESAYRYGFYSIVDIIMGFPDETTEERIFTLNRFKMLNKKFPSRLHIHYFLPLAGTPLYYSEPSLLNRETLMMLAKLEKDGRAKGWWRKGNAMVEKIVRMRDRFGTEQ